MGHADTLLAMGGAFLAAAFLARLGRRIGLPTIPLFMLAGILLGPHTPGPVLVGDPHDFEMLSALGLVLLLFYLGLEFHLDDLRSGGRRLLTAGGIYLLLNVGAGLGFGLLLGWGTREALVLAGVMGISSSAIVTKILIDLGRISHPRTRLILGVIVVEDIFLALYLGPPARHRRCRGHRRDDPAGIEGVRLPAGACRRRPLRDPTDRPTHRGP